MTESEAMAVSVIIQPGSLERLRRLYREGDEKALRPELRSRRGS